MKNIKMILTAVGIFAVVGSALAYNSKRGVRTLRQCNAQNICVLSNFNDAMGVPTGQNPALFFKQGTIGAPCTPTNCTVNPQIVLFQQ